MRRIVLALIASLALVLASTPAPAAACSFPDDPGYPTIC